MSYDILIRCQDRSRKVWKTGGGASTRIMFYEKHYVGIIMYYFDILGCFECIFYIKKT